MLVRVGTEWTRVALECRARFHLLPTQAGNFMRKVPRSSAHQFSEGTGVVDIAGDLDDVHGNFTLKTMAVGPCATGQDRAGCFRGFEAA